MYSKNLFPSNPATGTLGSIDFNIYMIQCAGVPLFGAKKETMRYKTMMAIYGIMIVSLATFIYPGFEMHDLVLSWGNLNELTQNACISLTHVAVTVKVVNVFYRRKDILRIIQQVKFLTKRYVISDRQIKAFYNGENENKLPLAIYGGLIFLSGIMSTTTLMLNPATIAGKVFPFRNKMPEFIPYSLQLLYMAMAVHVCAMQAVGVDYLNITMINQVRYQLKILNIAFDDLAVDEPKINVNEYINNIVEHHNFILEIRRDIENIFKFPLLLQFFISLLIFALTGFQATVSSGVVLIYIYFVGIFLELLVYCWFGNEVSEQNKTLASRGYNSSWYNFDLKYKKSLIIFLMNAQKPLAFTAGGFFELSLVTFSGILSKSYTYIAVLRQFYAEK